MNTRKLKKTLWAHAGAFLILGGIIGLVIALDHSYRTSQPWVLDSYAEGADCLPGDTYDAEFKLCQLSCTSLDECYILSRSHVRELGEMSDVQLQSFFGFYLSSATTTFFDPTHVPILEVSEQMAEQMATEPHVIFSIRERRVGDTIEAYKRRGPYNDEYYLWNLFNFLLPSNYAASVARFQTFYSADPSHGYAFVEHAGGTKRTWQFTINRDAALTPYGTLAMPGQLMHTLVHELGHIITLGNGQVGIFRFDCGTIAIAEGCVAPGAYLDAFTREFWPQNRGEYGDMPGTYRPVDFVSRYAAENPAEDMAESWAAFVLLRKPQGHTAAEEKIRFFYRYPELVSARASIRERLARLP